VGRARVVGAPPELELRGLDFAYDGRAPALRAVDLRVPAGGFVAVVGPTGSGKSTLGALVTRLFDPPRGAVRVDGVDVLDLPLAALRGSIGYLPQEPFLFSRSVRDNVLLGPDRGDGVALDAAARAAGVLDEVARLPEGWDTVVGERGVTLSGGQRQRVALARALVGDPPLLLLDDPFASVDPHKEREILDAVLAARRGRTTLLMTHRLRAAAAADRIAVLDGGVVVESGTHAQLLAAGGLYARLWRLERIGDELAPA
jgi:ATP-binding cassette subfamily B protein